jgi:hypothetical protein
MKQNVIKGILAGALLIASSISNAALLLTVDLTVENTISISATDGASLASISGSDGNGFYLANFLQPNNLVLLRH